jgi:phage terminase large subunit
MFATGPLFKENLERYWDPKRPALGQANCVVNQGGTDSSKTYTMIQLFSYIGSYFPVPSNGDIPLMTVLNESIPNSKKGPYRIFEQLYSTNEYLRDSVVKWDRGSRTIHFDTGWILEFISAPNEQQAKQGKRQYLFVNEAQAIPWLVFWQMCKKTRICTYIDYNPTAPFWAHDELISKPHPEANELGVRVRLIISDHRHNPFLSKEDHARTEGIKDKELFRVYARGLTGNMSGIIYPNWKMIADSEFPDHGVRYGAVDFGYTNDPTAGVLIRKIKRDIYVKELCYETGLPDRYVRDLYRKECNFSNETPVYCERDLATIREFRLMGLMAYAAEKGNVTRGIHVMKKEYNFYYTSSSKNLHEELKRYQWMTDPDTGKATNEPIDAHNHLLDAIRYGVLTHKHLSSVNG